MNAIGQDEYGHACIDYDKCVSCGMCLVNCPFGAIVDKGQLFQLIHAIRQGDEVVAVIAPAFWGPVRRQRDAGTDQGRHEAAGLRRAGGGSRGRRPVRGGGSGGIPADGAGEAAVHGHLLLPGVVGDGQKEFPGFAPYISMTMTPMVLTARLQKRRRPGCRVVFIGPCAAKKLEASRRSVRSDVDFVITFEELRGMFEAKNIDFSQIPDLPSHYEASAPGVGFAAAAAWPRR